MKLTKTQAALLNASERALVQSKGPWHVKTLVNTIKRTRTLRDKQRDLLQRQSIAATPRATAHSADLAEPNARTAAKADLFARALEGFETELRELGAQSSLAAKELGKAPAKTARQRPVKPIAGKASAARQPAATAPRIPRVGLERKNPRFSVR